MKKLLLFSLFSTLIMIDCQGMDRRPTGQLQPKKPATPLKVASLQKVTEQTLKIIRESIRTPILMQQKIEALLQKADGAALKLIAEQLYEKLKKPITAQLVRLPLITIPQTANFFIENLEFSPSGNHCMVSKNEFDNTPDYGKSKPKMIEIYAMPHFELVTSLSFDFTSAHYSPSGNFISAYNKKNKKQLTILDIHNDFKSYQIDMPYKFAYCFNQQEDHLMTCNQNGLIKLFDITTQKEITAETQIEGDFFPHIEPIKNYIIALSADKRKGKVKEIVVISENNNEIQQHIIDVSNHDISCGYCQTAFYPAKNLLALSSGSNLFICDLKTDQILKKFTCDDSINAITFHPQGDLVAASEDWMAGIWNISTGNKKYLAVEDSQHVVNTVSFSPISNVVLSSDSAIRIWDTSPEVPMLIGSTIEQSTRANIIICPNTKSGLLFTASDMETIWLAPTPDLFNVQQLTWLYSAYIANHQLKGNQKTEYLKELENMIETIFAEKDKNIRALMHKIVSSS